VTGLLLPLVVALGALLVVLLVVSIQLTRVSGRVASVERAYAQAAQSLVGLGVNVGESGVVAKGLAETTAIIRAEVARTKQELVEIQAFARARYQVEQQTAQSVSRLEALIAGTHSKGVAGENILELAFARLPAEWQVRDLRVGNMCVEFALRLPNGLLLPIDSKWTATALLERFAQAENPDERRRLKGQIEAAVLAKAREVRKYVDPNLTAGFGVAAVPDGVYELCGAVLGEAAALGVALVSYSLFLPYLLLVFHTVLKTAQQVDLQQIDAALHAAGESLQAAQEELESRFARALTMLANSRDDLGVQLSKARAGLAGLRRLQDQPARPAPAAPAAALNGAVPG
jgi:DNA recombination protein RmuC